MICGKGVYPIEFAKSARAQGVKRLFAVAFKGETRPVIRDLVDEVHWLRVGQLGPLLKAFKESGVSQAVMVGQITPTALFRMRPDKELFDLLSSLKERNAHTIFGGIANRLKEVGVELAPAYLFMQANMPGEGLLSKRAPSEREVQDIELGLNVAKTTSDLDIGQTVVIKEGTILAVEAFEGTDKAIRRAGKLGGPGGVVIKVAKPGHDMRFDIPVIGTKTMKTLRKAGIRALAVEAGRTIILEREAVLKMADAQNLSFTAISVQQETS